MIELPVYDIEGQKTDSVEVDEARLGGRVNWKMLRQAVLTYEANRRVGTASAKKRSEVTGSNKKPWPQKGTGNARHGSRQSPLWVGGGVMFGPKPRDYRKKLSKNMKRQALLSAVLGKIQDDEALVTENLDLRMPKTREMARVLDNLGVDDSFLVVLPEPDARLWRCARNLPGSAMNGVENLNALEVLEHKYLLFTREGLDAFIERCGLETADAAVEE